MSSSLDRVLWRLTRHSRDFVGAGAKRHYSPDLRLEPSNIDIDLSVDLESQSVAGLVTTTIEALCTTSRTISLDAVDFRDLEVIDSDGHPLSWSYDGRKITTTWQEPFEKGESRRLAVRYRVEKPVTGLLFSKPCREYPEDSWFAVTDHETERARHWLPCLDHPRVRTTLSFHLRAESRLTILANGRLEREEEHSDGTKTAHWRLDQRCPSYITCFAIGDFTRADDGAFDGCPIAYFAPTNYSVEDLLRTFGRTGKMLAWLSQKLDCPFPYPKYFQVAVPGIGGAMENISLVAWEAMLVLDQTLAEEWLWLLDQINIHEMAHSYFGDWIVCRDFAHAWLKESWAVYIESCWLEDNEGADEALYDFYSNAQRYITEADERYKRPIVTRHYHHSWDMYDAHLYPGGACRLHMLRHELGDEVFWGATRDYVASFGGKTVETDDFRRVVERHSGRSLELFFEQWFYRPGYPHLKVSYEFDAERKQALVQIEQAQASDEKGQKEDLSFEFPLEIGWEIDGELFVRQVEIREVKQSVVISVDREPEQVRIDPNGKLLHKLEFNPGDKKLRRQLIQGRDVIGRIQAGIELAKTSRSENIECIKEAYPNEPFWGVRLRWAEALGKAGVQAAVGALVSAIEWEREALVLEPLLAAAGEYRDQAIRDAVQAKLESGLPYRARAAALETLGKQRQNAPFELLSQASSVEGYHGFEQAGACRGLAESRHHLAFEVLAQRCVYGATPHMVRPAAVKALAKLAQFEEKPRRERALDLLMDLLRDPSSTVRDAAVAGLEILADGRSLEALEAHGRALSEQDRRAVERATGSIQKSEQPTITALHKNIEKMQDRIRQLEDIVRTLDAERQSSSESSAG